ncbi:MAG: inositol monophosphatase family protein [Planctomycetaceae bacterium]|jgi:3'(2'), 5'-bisphosphate nucleotidase
MDLAHLVSALHRTLPGPVRWSGSVARRMRQFNIALEDKKSGSSNTDALTLADLTVQELLVGALRDGDPAFRHCRIAAEETTGDLLRFATDSPFTLCLDPIDGTKQYRDKTGNGYSVILTLQGRETLHYSLVLLPEWGPHGTWVEVRGDRVVTGPDDPTRPAVEVLASFPPVTRTTWNQTPAGRGESKKIYMIGFQQHDRAKAQLVTEAGLEGVAADDCPGSIYELMASGAYAGSLIHSPNIYDFPASLHVARVLGGDALWVHNRQPVNFHETWMDERAKMLRLPGIVATSPDRRVLDTLCAVARDWNPIRYAD